MFLEVWDKMVTPFILPKQDIEKVGAAAGSAFNAGLDKEMKKVDAVLRNSAEAFSRIAEYKERQPNVVKKTDVRQMVMAQQPPTQPNNAELESVQLLRRLVELTAREVNKEGIELIPADLP